MLFFSAGYSVNKEKDENLCPQQTHVVMWRIGDKLLQFYKKTCKTSCWEQKQGHFSGYALERKRLREKELIFTLHSFRICK